MLPYRCRHARARCREEQLILVRMKRMNGQNQFYLALAIALIGAALSLYGGFWLPNAWSLWDKEVESKKISEKVRGKLDAEIRSRINDAFNRLIYMEDYL